MRGVAPVGCGFVYHEARGNGLRDQWLVVLCLASHFGTYDRFEPRVTYAAARTDVGFHAKLASFGVLGDD